MRRGRGQQGMAAEVQNTVRPCTLKEGLAGSRLSQQQIGTWIELCYLCCFPGRLL